VKAAEAVALTTAVVEHVAKLTENEHVEPVVSTIAPKKKGRRMKRRPVKSEVA
jgi:nitric oxide synthase oxygenase domain/subunit